jgi:hypothetical protein
MPKMVSELAQGNAFSRSADGGALSDTATRVWKVILNSPDESWDIGGTVGVQIGDPYSGDNPVPCASIEARADGDSRLVRIVTVTYKMSPGGEEGGEDPKQRSPDIRPANFSTSTTLYEMPAWAWKRHGQQDFEPVMNPNKERVDGVTRFEPITTIRVTQFSGTPGTVHSQHCGRVNSEEMRLGAYMTCPPHTVMFRGVEATPHIESFGDMAYRGFMNSYEFSYRANVTTIKPAGPVPYGWDLAVPVSGFMVKNARLNDQEVDNESLNLKHNADRTFVEEPLAIAEGQNDKVGRAQVMISGGEGKRLQTPSAQPVALNEDGTPRSRTANPPILIWRVSTQEEINLTQTLQLRLT